MDLQTLKQNKEAPEWLTDEGLTTLQNGYLLSGETPKDMWRRVCVAAAKRLNKPELEDKFFELFWNNWLCGATPVLSNMGTSRGLPISCNSIHVGDSIRSIFDKQTELAVLSKNGAGVGIYVGDVRGRGSNISGNGKSEGVIPWLKCYDSTTVAVSQGAIRRGASAVYLPANHSDIEEFINIRRPVGDVNRRCLNLHHAVCIDDQFMNAVQNGGSHERYLWKEILKARFETGEPYLFFTDNVNRQRPNCYVANNLSIKTSNICNEIYLYTDKEHTFVCCLSSMNLFKYEEWKDTKAVQLSIWFLDAVIQEYIDKAQHISGLESAVRFAEKSRAVGLGVLGWHSLLQKKKLPFDSFESMRLNGEIFRHMQKETQIATKELAKEYGEPEWCKGFGIRNTHQMAVAPTVSNSIISGSVSAGIEPISANVVALKTAKGTFMRTNPILKQLLEEKGLDNIDTWKQINENSGSVSELKGLSDEEKEVFLTAREINQHAIVKQAGQRQKYIDQGQSVNLFFAKNSDPKYIHSVHMLAWEEGLKGLYYCRSEAALKGDSVNRQKEECKACEG
jgi:ribonucleoside-diphosphate reductase alpha chain